MLLCSAAGADQAVGLPDVVMDIVDGNEAIVSLTYAGTTYVVADGDLATGTSTRWYVDPTTQLETIWRDGDPTPPTTVPGTSNPKAGDQGWKADNFTFRTPSWTNDICSIDGIDFMQTVFPFLTDTIFVLERNGNDTGTIQAILADGSLGPTVALTAGGSPYASTGINVGGQTAYGFVFLTDVPVMGIRITAGGFDALSVCAPAGTDPTKAHDPQPENGAKGVPVNITLSWKTARESHDPDAAPNPAITGHNLWLSKAYDPANPPPNPDWEDPAIQIIELPADVNPVDGSVDAEASYSTVLQRDALYYWIVDESLGAAHPDDWDNIIAGSVWTFETVTSGPEVDAGNSIVTWLKEGTTTVALNGTVMDATGDVTTIQWSVAASPPGATVDIADASAAATTATLTQTGRYVLQLYAKDAGQHEASDLMEINVYADGCEAAKNSPDGYTAPQYDFNDDCKVNLIDLAMFADAWLDDASLTEDALYEPDTVFLPPFVEITNPLDGATVTGEVIINAVAYDEAVGTTDGDGMEGDGSVFFEVIDSSGAVLDTQNENLATFDMTWNTAEVDPATGPVFPNGVYTIRVTATSDAGYETIKEITVTVVNP
jgi:hypothetical protein